MARSRMIKPDIMEDEKSAGLSSDAWRLWVCMWMLADDKGRCRANAQQLHARVFWCCPYVVSVPDLLEELSARKCITRYVHNEEPFAVVVNFDKHQKIDKPSYWSYPDPTNAVSDSANLQAKLGEPSGTSRDLFGNQSSLNRIEVKGSKDPPQRRGGKGETSQKQPAGPRPLLDLYCQRWVELFKPSDGKGPELTKGDIKSAHTLLTRYGEAEASALVRRFLDDKDEFIAKRGHVLRDIHQRVNGYRASNAKNAPTGAVTEMAQRIAGKVRFTDE